MKMKTKLVTLIIFIIIAGIYTLISIASPNEVNEKKGSNQKSIRKITYDKNAKKLGEVSKDNSNSDENGKMPAEHAKSGIDCKSCHLCEYPTKNDPCLNPCPRNEMVSIYHSPSEGPVVVKMDDIKGDYGKVVFSHKLHAEMSNMSGGCSSCHHYNTTGPVLKCKTCHSVTRKREELTKPDLEAAYHRQCVNCHRQWERKTDCKACHITKAEEADALAVKMENEFRQKSHPPLKEPMKVVYDTKYEKGKIVTFFHDEHTRLFNAECTSCHQDENCIKCHDVKLKGLREHDRPSLSVKANKSFEDHHQPCVKCHEQSECQKCHKSEPMDNFNHAKVTGFDLGKFHSAFKCNSCHKEPGKFKGLNKICQNCHTNFKAGKYDHSRTGFILSENHKELECSDCHKDTKFQNPTQCIDCHDDKQFPQEMPGKYTVKQFKKK
jgi:hypothetical protein